MAGSWQGVPLRVFAPHRQARLNRSTRASGGGISEGGEGLMGLSAVLVVAPTPSRYPDDVLAASGIDVHIADLHLLLAAASLLGEPFGKGHEGSGRAVHL